MYSLFSRDVINILKCKLVELLGFQVSLVIEHTKCIPFLKVFSSIAAFVFIVEHFKFWNFHATGHNGGYKYIYWVYTDATLPDALKKMVQK